MGKAQAIKVRRMSWSELKTIGQATLRVLGDSSRTEDLVEIEEIMGQAQLKHLLAHGGFESAEGRELLGQRPELSATDLSALRSLPEGTLGRALVEFLDRHGYTPADYPTPYTSDADCAYVMRRVRMSHDVWHTLLGLGVEEHEEVMVHAFSLAQTGLPSSVGIVILGALKHMVLEGRWSALRHELYAAYRRGCEARSLVAVRWEGLWTTPLDEVRSRYGVVPMA